jgi:hypothetical protein
MSYFTTSELNLNFTYNSAKRTLTLKNINDFIRFWHCVKQPYCNLTLSNSWHGRFCFVLYLWEGRNKRYKATKNRKILMTALLDGLPEYTRRPIFVSASVQESLSLNEDQHSHFYKRMYNYLLVQCHSYLIWPPVLPLNPTYILLCLDTVFKELDLHRLQHFKFQISCPLSTD